MKPVRKICFVIDSISYGGSQIVTLELINLILKKFSGYEVEVLSLITSGFEKEIINKINRDIKYIEFNFFNYNPIQKFLKLKKYLNKFDVIHSCLELSNFYLSLINYFTPFKKFVVTFHGLEGLFILKELHSPNYNKLFPLRYRLYIHYFQNFIYKKCKNFLAVSDATKKSISKYRNIPLDKISTLYLGLDLGKIDASKSNLVTLRTEYNLNADNFVIGYLGRLSYGKGLLEFLTEFKELSLLLPNLRFFIIGDGELRDEITNKIKILNLEDKCIFTGYIANALPLLDIIDLIILPSFSEGVPISIMEAMYCSKLVLTSEAGGLKEIVNDGKNGFCFNINNFGEIKAKILDIYSNYKNYNYIKENANKTIIEKFDLNKNVYNFIDVLEHLQ